MDTNREKIIAIINKGSLSPNEIGLWENVLNNLPENLSQEILLALEKDPNQLGFLTENIKEKVAAVESKDTNKWDSILQKEKTNQ